MLSSGQPVINKIVRQGLKALIIKIIFNVNVVNTTIVLLAGAKKKLVED